eukprot:8768015-Alexandrium_andersonii.AAC.1
MSVPAAGVFLSRTGARRRVRTALTPKASRYFLPMQCGGIERKGVGVGSRYAKAVANVAFAR